MDSGLDLGFLGKMRRWKRDRDAVGDWRKGVSDLATVCEGVGRLATNWRKQGWSCTDGKMAREGVLSAFEYLLKGRFDPIIVADELLKRWVTTVKYAYKAFRFFRMLRKDPKAVFRTKNHHHQMGGISY
ncbi:unnamed protein product [Camellia sinensis]